MTDQPANCSGSSANRAALRRAMIAARLAIPADVHQRASAAILGHLSGFLGSQQAGGVGFCWPIRAEVDCRPLIRRLLVAGWRAAMPTVVAADAPMVFRAWSPGTPMTTDRHGIPIPQSPEVEVPDVLLLPVVGFDAAGYRLGYGGGYFDRTLAACTSRPLTIGVGFDLCRVESIEPAAHDIPLDGMATESGIRRFNPL